MSSRLLLAGRAAAVALAVLLAAPLCGAGAAEIMPHRALYTMRLSRAGSDSGVVGATGTMAYQWGETCDGWTIEQNYRLRMAYSESADVNISSNFVTWEAKDARSYRFNQRETHGAGEEEEIRGSATLDGAGKGGVAEFEKPPGKNFKLAAGVLFPTAHTLMLLTKAAAGENFVPTHVFDGATVENAVLVTAVIGPKIEPDAEAAKKSPLLNRPGWRVRLAFFPADGKAEKPDYELGMLLLDNGVSRNMVIDYGDYAIRATLDDIEALPKPKC